MVNPLCAQLLMPLAPDGALDNLFTALRAVAPGLAGSARQQPQADGVSPSSRIAFCLKISGLTFSL